MRQDLLRSSLLWAALVSPLMVLGQETSKSAVVTVNCYGPDAEPVTDELLFFVFRGAGAGIHQRGVFADGRVAIEVSFGKPVSIIVRGRDRSYVPYAIPPIAAHEGAAPGQISLAMNREVNSLEAKRQIELASRIANEAAPGSEIAEDLQNWAAGKKELKRKLTLTPTELKAVEKCLNLIRNSQLTDGAFVMKNLGNNPAAPVWVAPYFANYAALALLAENDRKPNPADRARVAKWLEWNAKNQAADGYWTDFEGTIAGYKSNGKVDAWDSSAALYLIVAERYRRSPGKLSPAVVDAAKRALHCIETVTDQTDGLTWATPTYKVKFLMDNIETYAGLTAAAKLFAATDLRDEADRSQKLADRIRRQLPQYWRAEWQQFAYALHENGVYETGMEKLYPHGLAQLFAIGFVAANAEPWTQVQATFTPDDGEAAAAGPERWLVAASRFGGETEREWRDKVTKAAGEFTSQNVYVYRPGVAALSLLEGADWMFSVLGGSSE